jgi:hypothetical protein
VNSKENQIYVEFTNDGWFIMGEISDGTIRESRWVLDRDKKVVFLYTEPERQTSVPPKTDIVEIEELTERTLILDYGKEVAVFENLNMATPEVQEMYKLQEVVVSDVIIVETSELVIEEAKQGDLPGVVEEVDAQNMNSDLPKDSESGNKEELVVPEEMTIQNPDSGSVKAKRRKGPRMEIVAEASALIGTWNIVSMNMGYGVMGKIEGNKNDEGYFDFKKDGSLIMNIKGQQTSVDGMKWVVDENNNTIFLYALSDEYGAESKAEFHKIYELYENKMTLRLEPLRWYFYLEKVVKE